MSRTGHDLPLPRGGGGMAAWAPPPDPPTHPYQKIVPQEQNEIYQTGRKWGVDVRHLTFFLASDPPPPPRVKVRFATKTWPGPGGLENASFYHLIIHVQCKTLTIQPPPRFS